MSNQQGPYLVEHSLRPPHDDPRACHRSVASDLFAADLWSLQISGAMLDRITPGTWLGLHVDGRVVTLDTTVRHADTRIIVPTVTVHYPLQGRVRQLRHKLAVWLLRDYFKQGG